MNNRPSGTVTFLFTDIEGSTQHWEKFPDAMPRAFKLQEQIIRDAVARHNGYAYKMVGDAFQIAFAKARDAIDAAIEAQRALGRGGVTPPEEGDVTSPLQVRVRMALHTGVTEERGDDYVGPVLNRAARLMAAGHGGQILVSDATESLVRENLPAGVSLRDLGERRLKDLTRAEHVFQVVSSDLPSDFPLLKTLDSLPNNLPLQLTSFIGREQEIAQAKKLLEKTHLLTLTGSGGCGKTRLSLEVAADLLDNYTDGIWFIELAPLADPELVPQVIATALGLQDQSGRPVLEALKDYLKEKNILLVLDNCEHLVAACAKTCDALLRACPHLKILASSREAVGIGGETAFRVPSLSLPDAKNLPPIETLSQYEAVRLFLDRALSAQPSFPVTKANASAIVEICQRLDGIPLAIELAAARIKALKPEEIAARLDDSFRLLTGGSRTAMPRQQTLRAAIDWGYNLLSEKERVLLRRLSVFAGGGTLDAVEEICSDNADSETQRHSDAAIISTADVLDLLTRLADKSLLMVDQSGERTRYKLLETIRQYAREKLDGSDESEETRTRHFEFFMKFAEDAEPKLHGVDQREWFDRVETEHDNLRVALEWSQSENRIEIGLRIAGALGEFWHTGGYWSEANQRLLNVLKAPGAENRTLARGKALQAAARIANFLGHFEDSRPLFEESISILRERGTEGRASLEMALGLYAFALHFRDRAAARSYAEEAERLCRQSGNKYSLAQSLNVLGLISNASNDLESARKFFEEGAAIHQEAGNNIGVAALLGNLGFAYLNQDDLEKATIHLQKARAIGREIGRKRGLALELAWLGILAYARGQYDEADSLLQQSLVASRELGDKGVSAYALRHLGLLHVKKGNLVQARLEFSEAQALTPAPMHCVYVFAVLAAASNQGQRAARLFGSAESLRERLGNSLPPILQRLYELYLTAVRTQMDEETFNVLWNEGRTMTMEQAIEYALESQSQESNTEVSQPQMISASDDEQKTEQQVEDALKHLHDVSYLAEHPLSQWRVVAIELQKQKDAHLSVARGKALAQVLVRALEAVRPDGAEPNPRDIPAREWHPYIILHDSYVKDEPNRNIMARLYISEGTFNRTRRRALKDVARALAEMERGSRK